MQSQQITLNKETTKIVGIDGNVSMPIIYLASDGESLNDSLL